jgi:hypothetical protein
LLLMHIDKVFTLTVLRQISALTRLPVDVDLKE